MTLGAVGSASSRQNWGCLPSGHVYNTDIAHVQELTPPYYMLTKIEKNKPITLYCIGTFIVATLKYCLCFTFVSILSSIEIGVRN